MGKWRSRSPGRPQLHTPSTSPSPTPFTPLPPPPQLVPHIVAALYDQDIAHVCCGGAHTLAVTADGTLFSFGLNDYGQLGHSPAAPFVPVRPTTTPQHTKILQSTNTVPAGTAGRAAASTRPHSGCRTFPLSCRGRPGCCVVVGAQLQTAAGQGGGACCTTTRGGAPG